MTDDELTRRAIIAAHDAECGDRHCEAVHMRSLSKREAAIVEAWRADRERLAREVMLHQSGQSYDVGYGHGMNAAAKYQLRAKRGEAAIERARAALLQGGQTASIRARAALAALDGSEMP